jgi:hypothetical protein
LLSGASIIVAQTLPRLPGAARKAAQVVGDVLLLGLWASQASPLRWALDAASVLRRVATLVLPWWGAYLDWFDRRAFQPLIGLALITTRVVPVAITLPIVIYANQQLALNSVARQRTSCVIVLMLISAGIAGRWLSKQLTRPLRPLSMRMRTIAQTDLTSVAQRGSTFTVTLPQRPA